MDITTYEEAAAISKTAWDALDYAGAADALRKAKTLVGADTVEQMPDGTLQRVPAEG